ncbi:hypothetical protein HNR65_003523 [Desulfosalsimonas propionicica]|uniref:Uncharacterized protein n=1 Tax=Desulfosalsimonas propionicica TaxID=332175 RepID=A0A7W0CCC7_9BACT|nr:hypothetical protein [Desulfosalsimonas propionicica]MBA2883162.1 hypothetical protein [Desulfosalsimonas propionicica]
MGRLKTRIEKLERKSGLTENPPRIFVGYHGVEVAGWQGNGVKVRRLAGESDKVLRDRAAKETGATVLYQLMADSRPGG